jgi:hypothetical protein
MILHFWFGAHIVLDPLASATKEVNVSQRQQITRGSVPNPTERRLQEIDRSTLTPLVRDALNRDRIEVAGWERRVLHGGAGVGGSIYRFSGTAREGAAIVPWSLILKVICAPAYTEGARAVFDRTELPSPFYWKREASAYRSGALGDLPGGLCAPRCFGVIEHAEEAFWLWFEEVEDRFGGQWPLEHYGVVARHLGQLNGAYLAGHPLPSGPWVGRHWLRKYTAQAAPVFARLRESLDHPLIRRLLPGDDATRLLELWEDRQVYLDILDRLPQVFCHMDAFRRNLFARRTPDGRDQTVAIDWAYTGQGAIGEELVPLVEASILFFGVEMTQAQALDEIALEGYLEGLRDAGWHGDPRLAQLGYRAASHVRYAIGALAEFLLNLLDEAEHPELERTTGLSVEQLVDFVAAAFAQLALLREGTRELLAILD